jgi:hypothetical protein
MEPEFKAFIVSLIAAPIAFAMVEAIDHFQIFSLTKYGSLQLISFLIGFSFIASREYFKKKSKKSEKSDEKS